MSLLLMSFHHANAVNAFHKSNSELVQHINEYAVQVMNPDLIRLVKLMLVDAPVTALAFIRLQRAFGKYGRSSSDLKRSSILIASYISVSYLLHKYLLYREAKLCNSLLEQIDYDIRMEENEETLEFALQIVRDLKKAMIRKEKFPPSLQARAVMNEIKQKIHERQKQLRIA